MVRQLSWLLSLGTIYPELMLWSKWADQEVIPAAWPCTLLHDHAGRLRLVTLVDPAIEALMQPGHAELPTGSRAGCST